VQKKKRPQVTEPERLLTIRNDETPSKGRTPGLHNRDKSRGSDALASPASAGGGRLSRQPLNEDVRKAEKVRPWPSGYRISQWPPEPSPVSDWPTGSSQVSGCICFQWKSLRLYEYMFKRKSRRREWRRSPKGCELQNPAVRLPLHLLLWLSSRLTKRFTPA
jgi:hypothetical protein